MIKVNKAYRATMAYGMRRTIRRSLAHYVEPAQYPVKYTIAFLALKYLGIRLNYFYVAWRAARWDILDRA